MSVLLDALKKAAEEKKNSEKSAVDSDSSGQSSNSAEANVSTQPDKPDTGSNDKASVKTNADNESVTSETPEAVSEVSDSSNAEVKTQDSFTFQMASSNSAGAETNESRDVDFDTVDSETAGEFDENLQPNSQNEQLLGDEPITPLEEGVADSADGSFKFETDNNQESHAGLNVEDSSIEQSIDEPLPEFDQSSLNPEEVEESDLSLSLAGADLGQNQSDAIELPEEDDYDKLMDLGTEDSFSQSLKLIGETEVRDSGSMLMLASEDTTVPIRPEDVDVDDIDFGDGSYAANSNSNVDTNTEFKTSNAKPKEPAVDDGFDWSLDELPGYGAGAAAGGIALNNQSVRSDNSNDINPILTGASNKPPAKKSKYKSTSILLLGAFVVFLMLLIGAYGISYYMEESENLDRSLKKYNLVGLDIKPKTNPSLNSAGQAESAPQSSKEEALIIAQNNNANTNGSIANQSNNDLPVGQSQSNTSVDSGSVNSDGSINTASNTSDSQTGSDLKESSNIVAEDLAQQSQAFESQAQSKKPIVVPTDTVAKTTSTRTSDRAAKGAKQQGTLGASSVNSFASSSTATSTSSGSSYSSKLPVVTINVTKSQLANGYEAYSAGNYSKAAADFEKVLQSEPTNLNALMGLGAIAVVNNQYAKAVANYEKVLAKEPNNLNALEAIANLSGLVPLNEEWNKQLFTMAEIHSQSAVLQNAVGNVHAKHQDWLKAQQSYFNAYANSPQNPDYMMNLAVSYDYLGEYGLAAQYYTQALGYASQANVNFNVEQVKSRLISLKQLSIKGN